MENDYDDLDEFYGVHNLKEIERIVGKREFSAFMIDIKDVSYLDSRSVITLLQKFRMNISSFAGHRFDVHVTMCHNAGKGIMGIG